MAAGLRCVATTMGSVRGESTEVEAGSNATQGGYHSAHNRPRDRRSGAPGRSCPLVLGQVPMIAALNVPGPRSAYDWISPAAAALRLGVGVRDVYRLIDTGSLPGYRIVGEVRLLAHEVDEFTRRSLA